MTEQGIKNLTNECKKHFRSGALEKGREMLDLFHRLSPKAAQEVIDWADARSYLSPQQAHDISAGLYVLKSKAQYSSKYCLNALPPAACDSGEHELPKNAPVDITNESLEL